MTTSDGENASTSTSGASVDLDLDSHVITVRKNDDPNGLLQFALGEAPSSGDDPRLTPAKSQVKVRVTDSEYCSVECVVCVGRSM